MDFEEANSLCGALPRDDLQMHKCIKSDISFDLEKGPFTKVMYKMKCMGPLHASLTDNLSDPKETSKMLVVIQIQTFRHTNGIGGYYKSRLASVLTKMIHQKK